MSALWRNVLNVPIAAVESTYYSVQVVFSVEPVHICHRLYVSAQQLTFTSEL